ncbi:2-dehydropantoate 2-reductase [Glycomyces buryatensis]|uniref:2-dehydropantoate 2-reductase n=1 Tax=Glycomyces buryatensis TaxID=2570927 RepID=A0A4S8QBA0_9ACTN|nr:2-dehydropantoate 2-reductase [Glycomyces buryatensis]THV40172.1 2-dehydropantoate 2-reductase [Glycomyces buryatensis]
MSICVYGAGSIGCYIGGRLAAAGAEVVFIGRERLARQITGPGLTLTDYRGAELRVPEPRYETTPEAAAEADLVLVAVKSAATAQAGEELAAHLRPGTVVISFQNGLNNAEVLRQRLPGAIVLAGMAPFNVVARGEGRFHCASSGDLEVEAHTSLDPFEAAFDRAGLPLIHRDDMRPVLAAKLLLNLNNAVNALSGLPLRTELSQRPFRRCLALAQREGLAAFDAVGLVPARLTPIPPRWTPVLLGLPDALFTRVAARTLEIDPHARSSMQDDLEAGRATEVDYLNGAIVALAAEHGRTTPVNARLTELVHTAEAGGRRDWTGPELLAALRP